MIKRRLMIFVLLPLTALAGGAHAANITRQDWGTTRNGEPVSLYTLQGVGGLEARISDFGGVIVNLLVPDRAGEKADIVLGHDDFASYERGGVYGALIGRFANRISNASFPLDGHMVMLDHPPGQTIVLHGGAAGFNRKVWAARMQDGPEPRLILSLTSPDGEGGMPGTVHVTVTYSLTRDRALAIDYRATTDKPTVLNLTNHSYFNLAGAGSGPVSDERLQLFADQYTPSDDRLIPTGAIASVHGTPIDMTRPRRVGDVLDSDFPEIVARKGMDINFVVRGAPGRLRPAARLEDPQSGRVMEVLTTQPGIQIYSDNHANPVIGKGGKPYVAHDALTFETQHFPDSPNQPGFPSTLVTPARPLHEIAVYRFSVLP